MNVFQKLFGKKPAAGAPPSAPQPARSTTDLRNDPNLIRVYDQYGRELFISKEEWRTNMLPGNIRAQWNDPDHLYSIIVSALNDGFRADIVNAARQLYSIDKDRVRGACVWGIVLMEEGRADEAEQIFRDFIAKHGEDGSILTNLAKVYARRKNNTKAEEILWHALEVDPNQDNAFGWYAAIHRERQGEQAAHEAMRRVAALPGSWRAQLWLARDAIQSRDLDRAIGLYKELLPRAGKPVPADLLMQMSRDLGNAGHLPQILQLVQPIFDPAFHGLQVGNNLIKANLDLGQIEAARRILNQLYAQNRHDWKEHLSYWDTEIAKANLSVESMETQPEIKIAMLTFEGPVWLKPDSPAAELFPAKPKEATLLAFLGSSAGVATNSQRVQRQLADGPGRMSRALPLFFAEQVEFGSGACTRTLVPWMLNPGGFVLSGFAWPDEDAAHYSREGDVKCDYVVVSHVKTQTEPWHVELRLIRSIDCKCLETLITSFISTEPQRSIPSLAQQLLGLLSRHVDVAPENRSPIYQVPDGPDFPTYLLRLEQLLAVRCGGMDGAKPGGLNNEREIVDGNIQLCLSRPQNVCTRILLVETLLAMKRARPDILPEFSEKLALLQRQHPLDQPFHGVVQRMVDEAFVS